LPARVKIEAVSFTVGCIFTLPSIYYTEPGLEIRMRGIAFPGGEAPGPEILKQLVHGADILVAADSGLIIMEEAGIRPHLIVGDLDSCGQDRLRKYPQDIIQVSPEEKDYTDTELAVEQLKKMGCDEIWLAGGGGGRVDHLFAIRSLFERAGAPARWYTANEEIRLAGEGTVMRKSLTSGSLVSVFPLGAGPWQAESEGLKWPLNGLSWERGRGGLGISNVVLDNSFSIRSVRGRFMVISPLDVRITDAGSGGRGNGGDSN
jgi:thiamine pyrophosphokinase